MRDMEYCKVYEFMYIRLNVRLHVRLSVFFVSDFATSMNTDEFSLGYTMSPSLLASTCHDATMCHRYYY